MTQSTTPSFARAAASPHRPAGRDVTETIRTRRTVRDFEPGHRLTEDELRALLSAAALAPTSFNIQNRHFVVVLDPAVRRRLQEAAHGQRQVGDASAVVVLTGDLEAHRRSHRYLRGAPDDVREQLERMALGLYDGNGAMLRDEACRSVGLAAMNLMLSARARGYDTCPMVGFDPERVSEVVGLDRTHPPLMLVAIGRATRPARPRLGLLDLEELVSIDRLGNHRLSGHVEGA